MTHLFHDDGDEETPDPVIDSNDVGLNDVGEGENAAADEIL